MTSPNKEDNTGRIRERVDVVIGTTGDPGTMQATIVRRVGTVVDCTVTYNLQVHRTTQMMNPALSQDYIAK